MYLTCKIYSSHRDNHMKRTCPANGAHRLAEQNTNQCQQVCFSF